MKTGLLLTVACLAAVVTGGTAAQADPWNFVTLQVPGATSTKASGINDANQIVGNYVGSGGTTHGFGYSGGTYSSPIDVPGASATTASGISNSGQVTGSYTDGGVGSHGFVETGFSGPQTTFDDPSGVGNTYANAINASGTIVGRYVGSPSEGFSTTAPYTSYPQIDYPGSVSTQANGIGDNGTIVGSYFDGTTTHGFVDTGGTYTKLDVPGSTSTSANGINAAGDIVGYYTDGGGTHGFVDAGNTFQTIDDPNAGGVTQVLGINNQLAVVGYYVDPNGVISGFVADVPEPGSIVLFSFAALGFARLRRRRTITA